MPGLRAPRPTYAAKPASCRRPGSPADRKSTRLNSSHDQISYAVFCLKKKKKREIDREKKHHEYTQAQRSEARFSQKKNHTVKIYYLAFYRYALYCYAVVCNLMTHCPSEV